MQHYKSFTFTPLRGSKDLKSKKTKKYDNGNYGISWQIGKKLVEQLKFIQV